MKYIISEQKKRLVEFYKEGRLGGVTKDNPAELSYDEAESLIALAENVAPYTFQPITDEVRRQLLLLRTRKVIRFRTEELEFMTMEVANGYLWLAARQEFRHDDAATRLQCQRIRHMIEKGFLPYKPNWEICFLDRETADKLIKEGERKIALLINN